MADTAFDGKAIVLKEQSIFFGGDGTGDPDTDKDFSNDYVYSPLGVVPNNGSVTFKEQGCSVLPA